MPDQVRHDEQNSYSQVVTITSKTPTVSSVIGIQPAQGKLAAVLCPGTGALGPIRINLATGILAKWHPYQSENFQSHIGAFGFYPDFF